MSGGTFNPETGDFDLDDNEEDDNEEDYPEPDLDYIKSEEDIERELEEEEQQIHDDNTTLP